MTNDPVLAKCLAWSNSGTSFMVSIGNVQTFAELLGPLFRHNNVSLYRCMFSSRHAVLLSLDLVLMFVFYNGSSRVSCVS